ncbi:hypothetical protein [Jannaschia sp. LMIT008]|uniref:hypothetical protein n=1 Tax=Jannaschia maritima TaxID=3032585 RepID=UPI0028118E4E|nr:hypothetical protein [Jannaschia sp. LMIT008]
MTNDEAGAPVGRRPGEAATVPKAQDRDPDWDRALLEAPGEAVQAKTFRPGRGYVLAKRPAREPAPAHERRAVAGEGSQK